MQTIPALILKSLRQRAPAVPNAVCFGIDITLIFQGEAREFRQDAAEGDKASSDINLAIAVMHLHPRPGPGCFKVTELAASQQTAPGSAGTVTRRLGSWWPPTPRILERRFLIKRALIKRFLTFRLCKRFSYGKLNGWYINIGFKFP